MTINVDDYRSTFREQAICESDYGFEQRLKNYAIQGELNLASKDARSGNYEEAILRLVDIIETLQETKLTT